MLSVLFSVVNLALISLHPLLINTSAFANLVNLRISILPHYLPKKNWIGTWTWQNNHSFQLTLPTTCIFAQNKLRELGEGWWFVKSGIIQISELLSMAGFSWGWMRPNMSRSAQFLWSASSLGSWCTGFGRKQRRLVKATRWNRRCSGKCRRAFQSWMGFSGERKIKKFVNSGQRNLHLKRTETGN